MRCLTSTIYCCCTPRPRSQNRRPDRTGVPRTATLFGVDAIPGPHARCSRVLYAWLGARDDSHGCRRRHRPATRSPALLRATCWTFRGDFPTRRVRLERTTGPRRRWCRGQPRHSRRPRRDGRQQAAPGPAIGPPGPAPSFTEHPDDGLRGRHGGQVRINNLRAGHCGPRRSRLLFTPINARPILRRGAHPEAGVPFPSASGEGFSAARRSPGVCGAARVAEARRAQARHMPKFRTNRACGSRAARVDRPSRHGHQRPERWAALTGWPNGVAK